jgi:hypothetical protein
MKTHQIDQNIQKSDVNKALQGKYISVAKNSLKHKHPSRNTNLYNLSMLARVKILLQLRIM